MCNETWPWMGKWGNGRCYVKAALRHLLPPMQFNVALKWRTTGCRSRHTGQDVLAVKQILGREGVNSALVSPACPWNSSQWVP